MTATRDRTSLTYSFFGVIIFFSLCDTNAIAFEDACCAKRHSSCQLSQIFLRCNRVQSVNAWNITLMSVLTNATSGDTVVHFNYHDAVLTYRNATNNKSGSENGVCRFRVNSRSGSRKKLHCTFLTLADTKLLYNMHHKLPRHKPCQCVCAFKNIPEDEDIAIQSNIKHVTSRSAKVDGNKMTEYLEPTVIFDWEKSAADGYVKIIVSIHTQYTLYLRLLTGERGDCCKNERAKVLRHINIYDAKKEVFDNLPTGNYCVRFTVNAGSMPTSCSYVNIPHADNVTSEIPTVIPKYPKSDSEKMSYVVIGIIISVIVLGLFSSIMYARRRRKIETHDTAKGQETELGEPFVNQNKKKIFVLYSHDCDAFVDVIKAFSNFLEVNFYCDVAYAGKDTNSLLTCQHAWIEDKLNSDVIIVVNSEGACLRQEALLAQRPVVPRGDFADYETCVFDQVLERLTREAANDYKKVFVVSFKFTSRKFTLKNIVPHILHEIPQDLKNLCSAVKFGNVKISDTIFLTENDAAYQNLLSSIKRCENWLKNNPKIVSECFMPIGSSTIQKPNTLQFSANRNEEDTDATFSSVQSNCTDLSETYLLAAIDV